jgi:hypothetical protein
MNQRLARATAGTAAGVEVAYLLVIGDQGGGFPARVVFAAACIAAMAALALAAATVAPRDEALGQALLVAAGTGLLTIGAVGLASIGILLIAAGLLGFAAAGGTRRLSWRVIVAISIAVVTAFVGGIALT